MTHDYPPLTGGGLAIGVRQLADILGGDHAVLVLSSRLADHAADDRHSVLPRGSGPNYARATLAQAAHATWRADMVIAHWTFSYRRLATMSIVLGPLLGKPTICVIHTAPDHCEYNRLRYLPRWARQALFALSRRALTRCAAVVALGEAHSSTIIAAGFRITHIAALPVTPLPPYRAAFLHHSHDTEPARVIGFAGELSPLKGADAIPALLRTLTPRYEFRIAGTGPLAGRLARCAETLPATQRDRVVLTGPIAPAAMAAFYRQVDCLVVLSRSEAHSRVTLEAMLAGVIVLASPTCGSDDLIVDGETGLLIDPGDPASIATILESLAAEPGRARAIRAQAERFAIALAADNCARWSHLLAEQRPAW